MKAARRIVVIDTTALIAGYNPLTTDFEHYTVPEVLEELAPESTIWLRFNAALEANRIKLKMPTPKFVKLIDVRSNKTGDYLVLSKADKQVIALALELKYHGEDPLILTGDYAVQNVIDDLGMDYSSISTFGIKHRYKWILYCPACFRRYSAQSSGHICQVCGTNLKRRVNIKKPLKKNKAE